MKKITILFYLFCFIPLMGIAQIDNDNCDNAIALECDMTVAGSTISATDSGSNAAPDVFYTYTGNGINENITLSLCDGGTDYDSFLRVFDDACNLVNQIAGNDDSCGLQSELTFLSDGVTTYTIMVEGFGASSGNYSLAVTCEELASCLPPDNLAANNFAVGSTDISWDVINNAVGYNWEIQDVGVPQGDPGAIVSGTTAATSETAMGAFIDGNSYTLYVQADCDAGDLSEFVSIDFVFNIPPVNDNCEDAIALECDTTVTGSTVQATDSGSNAAPDVFYTYTGNGINENITLSLCDGGTDYDSFLRVFDDECNLVNQIAGNDDSCGLQSELTFLSDGVTTYTIMVEGFGTSSGNYSLAVTCEELASCLPPNNLVANNFAVGSTDISWDVINNAIGYNWEIQDVGVPQGDPGAIASGTTAATSETAMGAFVDGNSYTLYVQADCDEDDLSEFVSIDFLFALPPVNDNCEDAIALECDTTVTGSTVQATDSGSNAAPDVFYTYTGNGSNENVTLSLCDGGTDYDSLLRVFDDECNLINEIAVNDDSCGLQSELTFLSDGVTTYTIMIEGFGTSSGNYSLAVTCEEIISCFPPTNLAVTNLTEEGTVDISWDASQDNVSYNWEIQNQGVPPGDPGALAIGIGTTDTSDTVTGFFEENVAYTLYVQSVCESGEISAFVSLDFIFEVLETSDNTIDGFEFFPNPVRDNLNVSAFTELQQITVYNMVGQIVMDRQIGALNTRIDLSSLKTGIYLSQVVSVNGQIETFRIVKE